MELEELKSAWLALENKLIQEGSIKEQIIYEMLHRKADRSLSRLIGYDLFGVIVILLVLPVFAWQLTTKTTVQFGFKFCLIYWLIFVLVGLVWQLVKLLKLIKVDLAKPVSHNIRIIHQYNIWIKKEKLAFVIVMPPGVIFMIVAYWQFAGLLQWVFLASVCTIVTLVAYWQYKRIYDTNIKSISDSLEKLKEIQ